MTWVKIDDRFTEHRKLLSFTRAERWTWLEVLCYCGRHGTGHLPADVDEVLRYVTPRLVDRWVDVGLLDRNPDGSFEVHDWNVYNAATLEQRVAAVLASNEEISANDVHRRVGGRRDLVLKLVAAIRGDTPNGGSPGTGFGSTRTVSPRARARTRPDPVLQEPATTTATRDDDDAGLNRLRAAGWTAAQLRQAEPELDRAVAWIDHADRSGARSPGGLAWSGFASSAWPPDARPDIAAGAQGPRSTTTVHPHVCPYCGPPGYPTESRLIEHLENVHDEPNRNGNDEPVVELDA